MDNLKYVYESVCRKLLREIELGKVEFSPYRVDGAPTDEQNTREEVKLHTMLTTWFGSAKEWPELAAQLTAAADDPRYRDFFRWMPPGVVLYRGLDMDGTALARMLGVDLEDLGSLKGRWNEPFTVRRRGRGEVTSWTTNQNEAEKFADIGGASRRVVVKTVTGPESGRFIDGAALTRAVSDWRPWRDEDEVLALGPVRATGAEWW